MITQESFIRFKKKKTKTETFFRTLVKLILLVTLLALGVASCEANQVVDIIQVLPGETCQTATKRGGHALTLKECRKTSRFEGRVPLKFNEDEVIILNEKKDGTRFWEFMVGEREKKK